MSLTIGTTIPDIQQEPVLFSGTVFQNVVNGLVGTEHAEASEEVQMRLVVEACRAAYAHDFIENLSNVQSTACWSLSQTY